MFQFTTTNVINSKWEHGYTPSGDETLDNKHSLVSAETGKSFMVKRVGVYNTEFITHAYKAEPVDAKRAKVVINLDDLDLEGAKSKQFRLNMLIGLTQASNDSRYANDSYHKGLPFIVEFTLTDKKLGKAAEVLADMINKYDLSTYGEKHFEVSGNGNDLTIVLANGVQTFAKLSIDELDAKAHHGLGEWTAVEGLDLAEKDNKIEYTPGNEGFADYNWILHNLRLPTAARRDFMAVNEEENPIPGTKYVQYTIHYCVNRGTLGLNAVGDQVTSHTTHVFFVKEDLAEEFETKLEEAGVELESVPAQKEPSKEDAEITD